MSTDCTLLPIAMLIAGYCFIISHVHPNPPPDKKDRNQVDRMSFLAGRHLPVISQVGTIVMIYHALLIVVTRHIPTRVSQICPMAHKTNPKLFAWNIASIVPLLFIYVGTYIRISAFGGLGKSFTLHLAPPDHLVTTGVYRWIQHPSYTRLFMIWWGFMTLFVRWDATPACWSYTLALPQCYGCILTATTGYAVWLFRRRVQDEEIMMRQRFGQQWEQELLNEKIYPGSVLNLRVCCLQWWI